MYDLFFLNRVVTLPRVLDHRSARAWEHAAKQDVAVDFLRSLPRYRQVVEGAAIHLVHHAAHRVVAARMLRHVGQGVLNTRLSLLVSTL